MNLSKGRLTLAAAFAIAAAAMAVPVPGAIQAPPLSWTARAPQVVAGETPPAAGETADSVRNALSTSLGRVQTAEAELEMHQRDKKRNKPRHKGGTILLARSRGAKIDLTDQKGRREEFHADGDVIHAYDAKDKEVTRISTGLPVVRDFAAAAMKLDVLRALTGSALALKGTATVDGEPCWVMEGRSPADLKLVGVPVVKMTVYAAKADGLPRRILIPEERGLELAFRGVRVNQPMPPDRLAWKKPKGAKEKGILGF